VFVYSRQVIRLHSYNICHGRVRPKGEKLNVRVLVDSERCLEDGRLVIRSALQSRNSEVAAYWY